MSDNTPRIDTPRNEDFWQWWANRFESNVDTYITPNNQLVSRRARRSAVGKTDKQKAMAAWRWLRRETEYELSKLWKVPSQTLRDRKGDCEDYTFLIASLLKAGGSNGHKIKIGELITPDGQRQLHTWNVVSGRVIDATGDPEDVKHVDYNTIRSYTIQ